MIMQKNGSIIQWRETKCWNSFFSQKSKKVIFIQFVCIRNNNKNDSEIVYLESVAAGNISFEVLMFNCEQEFKNVFHQ